MPLIFPLHWQLEHISNCLFRTNLVNLTVKSLINWNRPAFSSYHRSYSTVAKSKGHTFQDSQGSARSNPGCDHLPLFWKEALSYCTVWLKKNTQLHLWWQRSKPAEECRPSQRQIFTNAHHLPWETRLTAFYKLPCELSLKAYILNVNTVSRWKGHGNDCSSWPSSSPFV